ncbi:septum formation protein Maf [Paremcibacter congregatus]|uniref:Nucleoside triphosphate pyrophosphatase n=2 Tax=Paremcibacter congregatus TaxID=2043170 RepID=A0A2G4YPN0_9PROT|nr:septum formation protein Maf [Paremcibacter congregatus]QDE29018.1 septum formation protein Maf [Paremcibacter congregatus]
MIKKKMLKNDLPSLVLASASRSRRQMLEKAGIECITQAADIDEGAVKIRLQASGAGPEEISEALAVEKARVVAQDHPGKVILGGDQILVCEGRLFDKPVNREEAATHLAFFRGKQHYLYTSYALLRGDQVLTCETVRPRLVMRDFSADFLEDYLDRSGDKILSSVGGYLLEDLGSQLFSEIEGDYYAILGLPLLQVMRDLRALKILKS